ncbi:MAG TPA: hypothetical protein VJY62_18805 [Bacteroidia bacterium]|nr:hypothetical protein [Bacteroidia bacterium]
MIKSYPCFYLLFVLIYLTGRIGMVSLINSSNEYKRYINFQVIPQNISREIAGAFKKEEQTAGHIFKISSPDFEFEDASFIKNIHPFNSSRASYTYSGHYIDPPKLT